MTLHTILCSGKCHFKSEVLASIPGNNLKSRALKMGRLKNFSQLMLISILLTLVYLLVQADP